MDTKRFVREKFTDSLRAVFPILGIVLALTFTLFPVSPSILLCFLTGGGLLVLGMMCFTVGAEISMTPMGEKIGASMTQTRKLFLIIPLSFLLGFIITVSEPDLQVLAQQVPSVPNAVLIVSVAAGVGIFLVVALLRMLFSIPMPHILLVCYGALFLLSYFVPGDFLAVAFDSGGVTTGPMTVPFIMALGVGISAIRNDRHAANDSFGLVALCSIGPILTVMLLGIIYNPGENLSTGISITEVGDSVELWNLFMQGIPKYLGEIFISLLPIGVFFALFQIFRLKLNRKSLLRIVLGLGYTYIGLVLFLTGANLGFLPAGNYLGKVLAESNPWVLIPVAMLMGYFIVKAEPAVYVLNKRVEEITDGAISARTMGTALSIGVSLSLGLAMIRIITGISILWFLVPGYVVALGISFFVPKLYTAIAFDSGGVASGPTTAAFLLPLDQGTCESPGGNVATNAFGVVAMVAMTPLITIQVLGLAGKYTASRQTRLALSQPAYAFAAMDENSIIEL